MTNSTQQYLDGLRAEVGTGKTFSHVYSDQCYIALVEGEITREEYKARLDSMPVCPRLIGQS